MAGGAPVEGVYPVQEDVLAYADAKRRGGLDDAARRAWRERLIEAALANPDHSWAPEALFQAGNLSSMLHEPERQEELLRACVEHPLVEPTTSILALQTLAGLAGYVRGDVVRALADYNRIAQTIRGLDPGIREQWMAELCRVPLRKADLLAARQGTGKTIPTLRGEDFGKRASDYYQEFLDLPPRVRAHQLLPSEANVLQAQARAFVQEGRGERAAQTYRKLLEHPDNPHPASFISFLEAEARYPDGGRQFRKALEQAERRLAPDSWSRHLSYKIAWSYYQQGLGQGYIDRVEPMLAAEDPADRGGMDQSPDFRASVLFQLGECYAWRDVKNYERAVKYYEQLLAEFPDYRNRHVVYLRLGQLYRYSIKDYKRAMDCYETFLAEFADDRDADMVRSQLERLYERPAEETASEQSSENANREEKHNELP